VHLAEVYRGLRTGSCDSSYSVSGKARFRVNIFSQRGNYSIVLRKLNTKIPTLEELRMPQIFHQIAKEKTGAYQAPYYFTEAAESY